MIFVSKPLITLIIDIERIFDGTTYPTETSNNFSITMNHHQQLTIIKLIRTGTKQWLGHIPILLYFWWSVYILPFHWGSWSNNSSATIKEILESPSPNDKQQTRENHHSRILQSDCCPMALLTSTRREHLNPIFLKK